MRAIVTAPVARDLSTLRDCIRIPGATNGTLQAWDCNYREQFADMAPADLVGLTIFTTRASVPAVIKAFLVQVERSDSATASVNRRWKRLADCGTADYFRVRSSGGAISVKRKSQMVAGDRPVDWCEVHSWAGVADDMGET